MKKILTLIILFAIWSCGQQVPSANTGAIDHADRTNIAVIDHEYRTRMAIIGVVFLPVIVLSGANFFRSRRKRAQMDPCHHSYPCRLVQ